VSLGPFQKVPSRDGVVDALHVPLGFVSWSIVLLQLRIFCPPASLLEQPVAFWDEVLL